MLIQKRYKFGNEYKEILNLTSSNNYSIVINEKLDRGKVFVGLFIGDDPVVIEEESKGK